MTPLKLGISGARGVVGESLTPEVVVRLAAAFAADRKGTTILVGGDTRVTGPMVRSALIGGLTGAGCGVLDCGICPTPSILLAASRRETGGGILVTASHNPIEWNALKFVGRDGFFLGPEEGAAMIRRFHDREERYVPYNEIGTIRPGPDVEAEHAEAVLSLAMIEPERVKDASLKVVLDGTGGAGTRLAIDLLERLGCELHTIHCGADGYFPRPPEPKPENLGDLCRKVKEVGADIGFALDPDGDRLSLVSDEGEALVEETTLALAVDHVLAERPGPVVINLSTSRIIEDLAGKYGVSLYRAPVGEAHVAAEMVRRGAGIGGEGNGGVMFSALHSMRDAAIGIALILQSIAAKGRKVGAMVRDLPQYIILKSVIDADQFDEEGLFSAMVSRFGEPEEDRRDGIRLAWERKWVHVRPSNTEPVVRIIAEAPSRKEAEELRTSAARALGVSGV